MIWLFNLGTVVSSSLQFFLFPVGDGINSVQMLHGTLKIQPCSNPLFKAYFGLMWLCFECVQSLATESSFEIIKISEGCFVWAAPTALRGGLYLIMEEQQFERSREVRNSNPAHVKAREKRCKKCGGAGDIYFIYL
jgi:hypothetical protein